MRGKMKKLFSCSRVMAPKKSRELVNRFTQPAALAIALLLGGCEKKLLRPRYDGLYENEGRFLRFYQKGLVLMMLDQPNKPDEIASQMHEENPLVLKSFWSVKNSKIKFSMRISNKNVAFECWFKGDHLVFESTDPNPMSYGSTRIRGWWRFVSVSFSTPTLITQSTSTPQTESTPAPTAPTVYAQEEGLVPDLGRRLDFKEAHPPEELNEPILEASRKQDAEGKEKYCGLLLEQGKRYRGSARHSEAVQAFTASIQNTPFVSSHDPTYTYTSFRDLRDAYIARARTFYDKGEYSACIQDCEALFVFVKDNTEWLIHLLRGAARERLGDYTGALEDFRKLYTKRTSTTPCTYNEALALYKLGRYTEARECCSKAFAGDFDKNQLKAMDKLLKSVGY